MHYFSPVVLYIVNRVPFVGHRTSTEQSGHQTWNSGEPEYWTNQPDRSPVQQLGQIPAPQEIKQQTQPGQPWIKQPFQAFINHTELIPRVWLCSLTERSNQKIPFIRLVRESSNRIFGRYIFIFSFSLPVNSTSSPKPHTHVSPVSRPRPRLPVWWHH